MDASVNMKMSPDEHRLLVSAIEEARDSARKAASAPLSESTPQAKGAARERYYLLDKLRDRL